MLSNPVELRFQAAEVWVEESGIEAGATSLRKSGLAFGYLLLIVLFSFLLYQAWHKDAHKVISKCIPELVQKTIFLEIAPSAPVLLRS